MMTSEDSSYALQRAMEAYGQQTAAYAEMQRPSILLRPKVFIDGTQWCALYGDNLQDGVAGFGRSPEEAFRDFDDAWIKFLPIHADESEGG